MNKRTIDEAEAMAKRFLEKMADFKRERDLIKCIYGCPKESGALRRASMDLTRALAEMRRPG